MFDQRFTSPEARRHVKSLFLTERVDYLRHCADQGYALSSLQKLAADLLLIQNLLGLATSSEPVDLAAIEAAVNWYVRYRQQHSNYENCRRARKRIFSCAVNWLRFLKRLRLPSVTLPPYQPLKEDFVDYLRVQKGLSEQTLRNWSRYVEDFLHGFFRNHRSLRQLTLADKIVRRAVERHVQCDDVGSLQQLGEQ